MMACNEEKYFGDAFRDLDECRLGGKCRIAKSLSGTGYLSIQIYGELERCQQFQAYRIAVTFPDVKE